MGRIVVVEGLDGAGKRTLTDALIAELAARDARVVRFAFPRYGVDVHADLVADALYGRLGDLTDSVYGMSVLYALDRSGAAEELREAAVRNDVVLVDRFTASSAAYGAARLFEDAGGAFVSWLGAFENERLGVPVPDHHVLLAVTSGVAGERAQRREAADPGRARDTYESDGGLQERAGAVYLGLAERGWLSPWTVVDGTTTPDVRELAGLVGTP